MTRSLVLAGAFALAATAVQAAPPFDFAVGNNAEGQACRAQTRFGGDRAVRRVDLYCGDWGRPSGALAVYPRARRAEAEAALAADCAGTATVIPAEGFTDLRQFACAGASATVRRYGMIAEQGGSVVMGTSFPADWASLIKASGVLTGTTPASAVAAVSSAATPGMREISQVFPAGPPGQAAVANFELLRRRAYEKNSVWDFGGAQEDFVELLRAHDAVTPDDAGGSAEILAEIGLNLSGQGRFDESVAALEQASAKAREAGDAGLEGKIANYRAIDLLNQGRYQDAIDAALKANALRDRGGAAPQQAITAADAAGGQPATPSRRRRSLIVGLGEMSAEEKSAILSAQAAYVAGAAAVALRQPQAESYLASALARLAVVPTPPAWLVGQIHEQQARSRLNAGDARGAMGSAEAGLGIIRAAAPATRLEARLLLDLGRAQRMSGQADLALATERKAVAIFAAQQVRPGMPADIASEHLAGLHAAWSQSGDAALAAEYFEALALTWDGAAARSASQLAARLASKEASGEARSYQDAERAYRASLARRERIGAVKGTTQSQLAAADDDVKTASKAMVEAEDGLRARSPRFMELLEPKVTAASVQSVLAPDEAYVRLVLAQEGSFGVVVTRAGVTPYRVGVSRAQATKLAGRLHDSNLVRRNRLANYDVAAAAELYAALFAPAQESFKDIKRLQIDASGPLASVPFAALLTAAPSADQLRAIKDDQDYRGLPWLGRSFFLAQSVGPAPFVRMRTAGAPAAPLTAAIFGDFQPDPKQVATRLAGLRNLSPHCQDEVERALARLQALPDTAGEAARTAALFTGAARVSLGRQFTDHRFLQDEDVTNASVIMLATHGVLGLSSCFAEPALLTSLGSDGDGLIEASELLDRQLKARLVVLSACDTAGGGRADAARTGLSDGGEALSGLARAFLYAGASSVMATQWKVDAAASGAEIQTFFTAALKARPLSEALYEAQAGLWGDVETSHPFYWAPFAIIGDGSITLSPSATAAAPKVASAAAGPAVQ